VITVLHTIDTNEPGGAEAVFIDLATRLPADQYRCISVICDRGWIFDELQKRGVEPILVHTQGSFNWRYLRSLISIIRREKVDLIQSHLFGSNVYCSIAGLLTGKPVVSVFHGAVDISLKERFLALKISAINAGASRIIAVSERLRESIVESVGLRDDMSQVIYNGIVTSDFTQHRSADFRERFGWAANAVIVGSIGNIHPAKGYDVLLRAAAILNTGDRPYRFVIAGNDENPLYPELVKLRADLGLEKVVQFLGFYDDPIRFMGSIDMFLLPSISEGFSIATIEAMAAKVPVIATKCGGPEEIVTHGVNGWMIQPGSPEEIVTAVELLSDDPGLREALVNKAHKHVEHNFDIQAMLDSYVAVYTKLLEKH